MQRYSREEKQEHLARWRASGLIQKAYCEKHVINHVGFKGWGYALKSKPKFIPRFISGHVTQEKSSQNIF